LGDNGFGKTKTTKGGYQQWDHEDGSQVWVRPNGEIVRTGPKRPQKNNPNGKKVRDRYGPDGNVIPHEPGKDNHNTGEKIQFQIVVCTHSLRNC